MAAKDVSELKETITWLGRLIVGAVIIATYNKVDSDHDKNLIQDGQIAQHETRISNLEHKKKEVSFFRLPMEAILPTNELDIKHE